MTQQERLEERLRAYYDAEIAILTSQSYSIGGKSLTRADLGVVRTVIKELESKLNSLENSRPGSRVRRVVPMDL